MLVGVNSFPEVVTWKRNVWESSLR